MITFVVVPSLAVPAPTATVLLIWSPPDGMSNLTTSCSRPIGAARREPATPPSPLRSGRYHPGREKRNVTVCTCIIRGGGVTTQLP